VEGVGEEEVNEWLDEEEDEESGVEASEGSIEASSADDSLKAADAVTALSIFFFRSKYLTEKEKEKVNPIGFQHETEGISLHFHKIFFIFETALINSGLTRKRKEEKWGGCESKAEKTRKSYRKLFFGDLTRIAIRKKKQRGEKNAL
jgi:hypothetical protein